jgi:hypothetical protein
MAGKIVTIPGFTSAKNLPKLRKRLVMAASAGEKEGKTTLALSAPGPIAFFNLDIGLEGVLDQWVDKKQIVVAEFDYKDATNVGEWVAVWEQMKRAWMAALKNPDVRTLVMDTETEMWELIRLARFGKLTQVMPHHYGPVNTEYNDLIRKIYDTDKNLILLRKLKDEYINDKKTGNMEIAGFKNVPYLVQVDVVLWKKRESRHPSLMGIKGGGGTFGMTVRECRQNREVEGLDLEEPNSDFATLAMEVFPGTDPEDWE